MEQLRIPPIPQFDILVEYFKQELSLKEFGILDPGFECLGLLLVVSGEAGGLRKQVTKSTGV